MDERPAIAKPGKNASAQDKAHVRRAPAFVAALYSVLLLASLRAYGPKRTSAYVPLPKWRRRGGQRPSIHDILAQLRTEILIMQRQGPGAAEGLSKISSCFGIGPQALEMPAVEVDMAIACAMT